MSGRFWIMLLLSLSAGAPAGAVECALLPEARLRQLVPAIEGLEQTGEYTDRCRFLWPKNDRPEREAQNQELMKQMYRRGHENPRLQPLWNEITLDQLATAETPAAAEVLYERYLTQQLPAHYGSPDPLAGLSLEPLEGAGRRLAWNEERRQMLIQLDRRLLLLGVQLDDDPIKNKALALTLANALN